jgi:polysaccharide lyase-like protein
VVEIIGNCRFWTLLVLFQVFCTLSTPKAVGSVLYFPHFTQGGSADSRWETVFTFTNTSPEPATAAIDFLDATGQELQLDFGSGLTSHLDFTVPAHGAEVIQPHAVSTNSATGWARASSSAPIWATVHFRWFRKSETVVEIPAEPVRPMRGYSAPATAWTGVALVNPSPFNTISVRLSVFDESGGRITETSIPIAPLQTTATNLRFMLPVPDDFEGSIDLESNEDRFLAWTTASDGTNVSENDGVPRYGNVLWSAGFETGDTSEWYAPSTRARGSYGGGEYNSGLGNSEVSQEFVHSGSWALKMTIDTSIESGTRMFRWQEPQSESRLRYSAWHYFPKQYRVGQYWNIIQWKSKTGRGRNDPFFILNVGNRPDGSMYFYVYDWQRRRSYSQEHLNLPVGKWFRLEAYYQCTGDDTGQVTFWQDGQLLIDISNVQTRYPNGDCQWSINNYSDGLSPAVATTYIDDASISTDDR